MAMYPLTLEQWGSVAQGSYFLGDTGCISSSPRDLVFSKMRGTSLDLSQGIDVKLAIMAVGKACGHLTTTAESHISP